MVAGPLVVIPPRVPPPSPPYRNYAGSTNSILSLTREFHATLPVKLAGHHPPPHFSALQVATRRKPLRARDAMVYFGGRRFPCFRHFQWCEAYETYLFVRRSERAAAPKKPPGFPQGYLQVSLWALLWSNCPCGYPLGYPWNYGCPCRIIRATTDIRSKPRTYTVSVASISARISAWISVLRMSEREVYCGYPW